jgi:hypothetical protein
VAGGALNRKELLALRGIRLKSLWASVRNYLHGIQVKGSGRKISRISGEVNASPETKSAKDKDDEDWYAGETLLRLFFFASELAMNLGQLAVRKVLGKRTSRRRIAGLIT